MTHFIKVADTDGTCDFIDLDKVTKVACAMKREKTGGGFNIARVTDSTVPKTTPASESVTAVVMLSSAGGEGEMHFSDLNEAAVWAKENLGISVPFDQL